MPAADLVEEVRAQAERAVDLCGAGGEGFGVAVTWSPIELPTGMAVAWMFLLSLPSLEIGETPLGVTSDPVLCQSVPKDLQVKNVIGQAVHKLRTARQRQKERAVAAAEDSARIRLN